MGGGGGACQMGGDCGACQMGGGCGACEVGGGGGGAGCQPGGGGVGCAWASRGAAPRVNADRRMQIRIRSTAMGGTLPVSAGRNPASKLQLTQLRRWQGRRSQIASGPVPAQRSTTSSVGNSTSGMGVSAKYEMSVVVVSRQDCVLVAPAVPPVLQLVTMW
jgi:hypothetical protein